MARNKGTAARVRKPLHERMEMARKVNQYRAAHPKASVKAAITTLGLNMSEKNYWPWRKVLELETLKGEEAEPEPTEFPLAAIPERPAKRARVINLARHANDDKQIAALLLEVAARLLRR